MTTGVVELDPAESAGVVALSPNIVVRVTAFRPFALSPEIIDGRASAVVAMAWSTTIDPFCEALTTRWVRVAASGFSVPGFVDEG